MFFWFLDAKPCRTIMKLPQKVISGPTTCEIWWTVIVWTYPDLPRPVQEDKSLLQTSGNIFLPKKFTTPSFFYKVVMFEWKIVIYITIFMLKAVARIDENHIALYFATQEERACWWHGGGWLGPKEAPQRDSMENCIWDLCCCWPYAEM